jgi:hypothetical protein
MEVDQGAKAPTDQQEERKETFGLKNDFKYDKNQQKKKTLKARKKIPAHPMSTTKSSLLKKRMFPESNLTRDLEKRGEKMDVD